ncbi:hypothetical protein BGZ76_004419 [Entomortierella beljakovae]|nr:hypothetical protein BGZ76_004419 [Entomortierella beljakovae]
MRTSLILTVATAFLSTIIQQTNAQECNGYAELCSKTYDQVTYATAHNAFAYTPAGALALNQDNDIPTQLNDGIRALMFDAYTSSSPSDIQLCHSSCTLLDAGPLSKALAQIKTFMDAHPSEVITIFWENAQNLTPAQFEAVYSAAGMANYLYTQPPGNTAWPTLTSMIASGKRLVNFVDSGADSTVPWLMAEYDFIFETPWQIAKGAAYPCTVDRPKDQRKQMYVMNHFISGTITVDGQAIDLPQPGAANVTNGDDLITHVNTCQSTFSQKPTFIALDFYEKGQVFPTIAQLNGVTWNGKTPTQPKAGSGSGSGSGPGSDAVSLKGSFNTMALGIALTTVFGLFTL